MRTTQVSRRAMMFGTVVAVGGAVVAAQSRQSPSKSGRRDALLRSLNLERRVKGIKGSHAPSGLSFDTSFDGEIFALHLGKRNGESLEITGNATFIELTSPRGFVRLTPQSSVDTFERIPEVLSVPAFQQFRALTAELENEPDTLDTLVLAFAGAMAGLLARDRNVIVNLHQRQLAFAGVQQGQPIARLQAIRLSAARQDTFRDCWGMYERALMAAWEQYERCWYTAAEQWWNPYGRDFCAMEYLMRSQSYWWQYLACSAYPF
jgi:hypothetical protein